MPIDCSGNAPKNYGGSVAPPETNPAEWQPKRFFLKEKIREMLKRDKEG